jgi:hypothetical protein
MNTKNLTTVLLLTVALALLISGCSQEVTNPETPLLSEDKAASLEGADEALALVVVKEPTEAEITDLLFIREEEKMARDVYIVLGDLFGQTIFANISLSEQRHMDSVLVILDRYLIEDPVGENEVGVFVDQVVQELYNGLITDGSVSPADALLSGLAIEEIDIGDLEAAADRAVLPDIIKVYGKLCDGSKNHLRSFVADYEALTGETYVPRYLSQEDFDEIMGEDNDHGGNGRHWTNVAD